MRDTLLTNLTERQKLILKLMADDLTEAEIAQKLGIRPKTLEFHKLLIRQKIREAGASDLARFAAPN